MNARARSFWREEIALVALLLAFFAGIVCFALPLPFDARLFPLVIGGAGILLTLAIAAAELRRPLADVPLPPADDPGATAGWPRFLTALLWAPAGGWLHPYHCAPPGRRDPPPHTYLPASRPCSDIESIF